MSEQELLELANGVKLGTLELIHRCGYRYVIEDGRITAIIGEEDE